MDVESAVRKAAGGDLDAFGTITHCFQHMAFGYALGFVRDFRDAEDVVQEAFVAAWFALPTLAEPAADAGWLRAIVRHRAHRLLRRKQLEVAPLASADAVAADTVPADDRMEQHEQVGAVFAAIADLPPPAAGRRRPLLRPRLLPAGHRHLPGPDSEHGEQPFARRTDPAQEEDGHHHERHPSRAPAAG